MTANQIAYAELQESKRHNQANEEETNRHNVATESIQDRLASIEEDKNRAHAAWEAANIEIQKEYNKWYAEYQTASTKRKLEIEGYLANLKDREINNNERYQTRMTTLKQDENALLSEKNKEVKRHNEAMETVSTFEALLTERRMEYENTFWRETIGVNMLNAESNWLRASSEASDRVFQHELELGYMPYKKAEMLESAMKMRAESTPFIKPLPLNRSKLMVTQYLDMFRQ